MIFRYLQTAGSHLSAILSIAALLLICSAQSTFAQEVLGNSLQPHKAIYEIKMISKSNGSQLLNISGEMFYEWQHDCDAWITDNRFNLYYEYAETPTVKDTADFSTYEKFDGSRFEFNAQRKRNGQVYEEFRGFAQPESEKEEGRATYTTPEGLEYTLPAGTLFPMQHTIDLINAAKNKEKFFNKTVYDGSDEDGPAIINAFIGKPVNAMANLDPSRNLDPALVNTQAWKIHMAFFQLSSSESSADYEIDAIIHDNGIISDMIIDYYEFAIAQKLIAIEPIEDQSCKE